MTTMHAPAARHYDRRWLVLIPIAVLLYMLAYVDRTNIGLVLPYMSEDLGLDNADGGLASGIFSLGYLVLQVPVALLAQRWSARKSVFILMILWSLAAMANALVQTRTELFVARAVVGFFEGGVQPAVLVLLASWFAQRERARANGFWLAAFPLSSLFAAPITGWLLQNFDWRAVFFIEGLPPLIWAFVWYFVITDTPRKARWVPEAEALKVEAELAADEAARPDAGRVRWTDVLRNPRVWALAIFWVLFNGAYYGFTLWLPTVVKTLSGGSPEVVGWLTAVPYIPALIGMITIAIVSDRLRSRRWPVALPLFIGAVALTAGQLFGSPVLQFITLCIVGATLYIHGPFLATPAQLVPFSQLGLALGLINGIGNLGGFFGPYVVGALIDSTGSTTLGFTIMSLALVAAGILILIIAPKKLIGADPAALAAETPPVQST